MRHPLLTALLASSLTFTAAATDLPMQAPIAADATLVSISAQGSSRQAPDLATFSTGVVSQAADAKAAMAANAQKMTAVMAALAKARIPERDIQTTGLTLQPQYRYAENQPPTITGYEARNTVNVQLEELDRMGDVIDALVASGSNELQGPSFGLKNPEAARDVARREAITEAQRRAKLYADATGLMVRRIVRIDEGGNTQPQPMPMMRMAMDSAESTPVSPGQATTEVTVNVLYEFGPKR